MGKLGFLIAQTHEPRENAPWHWMTRYYAFTLVENPPMVSHTALTLSMKSRCMKPGYKLGSFPTTKPRCELGVHDVRGAQLNLKL